ncbi:STAS domain-containing protein [Nonomuraea sp. NPDC049419]|uniref:STAS domain-containing protein n=1 Tax=Nonomuraea sp. NPDC049419 TaxID=3155772 RepID=UPI0034219090
MRVHIACQPGGGRESAASPLTLGYHTLDDGVLITASGEVDITNAARLETYVRRRMLSGRPVVLDLTLLTFMDSNGVRVIERLHAACAATGSTFHLAGVRGIPARLLQITGLWDVLDIHAGAADAVSAAQAGPLVAQPWASGAAN